MADWAGREWGTGQEMGVEGEDTAPRSSLQGLLMMGLEYKREQRRLLRESRDTLLPQPGGGAGGRAESPPRELRVLLRPPRGGRHRHCLYKAGILELGQSWRLDLEIVGEFKVEVRKAERSGRRL